MEELPSFSVFNYTICAVYLAVMFSIGLWLAGKQKTTEDYFLAGRKMPWIIVAMSMFASLTSASIFIGMPGLVYRENISQIAIGIVSVLAAPFFIYLFYPFYRRLRVTTTYEYIGFRYGRPGRYAVSGLFVLLRLSWLGIVIYSPSLALSVATGVDLYLAILLMGVLATTYTVLGGLSAVLWTDAIQFIILVGGAIWVSISLLNSVPDGWSGIIAIASETNHLNVFTWKISIFEMSATAVAFTTFIGFFLNYGIDQVTVQRLLATKKFSGMVKATVVNSFIDFIIVGLLIFIGIGMFAFYHHFPEQASLEMKGDRVLPFYIMQNLPDGVSGLLITAIFAAAMSSMDSGINSVSTVIVNDFVKPLRRKARTEHQDVQLARILTFVLGALAVIVACYVTTIGEIIKAAGTLMSLFGGPILGLFLLGIFTQRANFLGWVIGTAIAIPATFWLQHNTEVHFIYYEFFCLCVNMIVTYPASLILSGEKAPKKFTLNGRSELNAVE